MAIGAALALSVAKGADASMRSAVSSWLFVAILQGGIGYAQYFTGVPELLVGTHIAGATLLWVVTVRLVLAEVDSTGRSTRVERNEIDSRRLRV